MVLVSNQSPGTPKNIESLYFSCLLKRASPSFDRY